MTAPPSHRLCHPMILPYIPSLSESLSLPSLVVDGRISVSFFIVTLPPCQKLEILIAHILNFCTALETITQQIVIDGVVVAAIVYHLQRSMNTGIPPSAELIGVQRYKPTSTTRRTHARTQSQPYIAPSQHSPTMRTSHQSGVSATYFTNPTYGGSGDIPFTPYSHLDFPSSSSMPVNGFSYNAPSQSPDMFGVVESSSEFADRPYMAHAPRSL